MEILSDILGLVFCFQNFTSISHAQHKTFTDIFSTRAPVWTEELDDVSLDKYTEKELARMVRDFWTPERMKSAIPVAMEVKEDLLKKQDWDSFSIVQKISETVISLPASMERGNGNMAKFSNPIYYGKATGKVFYYNPKTKLHYVCSGSAINSTSKRIVATAAHCVRGRGNDAVWYQNWYFIPDYFYGFEPHGGFAAFMYWTPTEWVNQTSWHQGNNSDVTFVTTLVNDDNLRVVDAVGGHGIAYGGNYNFNVKIFGYPSNLEGGNEMWSCTGNTHKRMASGYAFTSLNGCNFGGGASGGPWLEQYSTATGEGILRGVSSWVTYMELANGSELILSINSPYFSSNIINLYNNANSADW